MILQETFTLPNGVEIPKIGLGTWFANGDEAINIVKKSVDAGYRHIDSAQAYQNEREMGEAIKNSGVPREEIFITTKLAAEIKSYDSAVKSIDESLEKLGLEYIDLMIIHSPKPWQNFLEDERFFEGNLEAWKTLEEAYETGKLKAIGVSNFEIEDLKNILDHGKIKPMVNQILAHISNTPFELIEFCKENDLVVEAYSPIGHGELLDEEDLKEMAAKYDVSVAQLAIRYCLQLDLLPLPKTTNEDRMKSNAAVDFEISDEDMETLKNRDKIEDYGEASMFPVYAKK